MLTVSALWILPAILAYVYGCYQMAMAFLASRHYVLFILMATFGVYFLLMAIACCTGAVLIGSPIAMAIYFVLNYLAACALAYFGLEAREDRLGVESRMKKRMDRVGHASVRTAKGAYTRTRDAAKALTGRKNETQSATNGTPPEKTRRGLRLPSWGAKAEPVPA